MYYSCSVPTIGVSYRFGVVYCWCVQWYWVIDVLFIGDGIADRIRVVAVIVEPKIAAAAVVISVSCYNTNDIFECLYLYYEY